jgi:regulator of CtrA degradation
LTAATLKRVLVTAPNSQRRQPGTRAVRIFAPLLSLVQKEFRVMAREAPNDDIAQGETLQGFIQSELFERTFEEGMALVEETARYLDGPGRSEARDLPRKAALLYAGESMRVTTRLMQAASWLLVQRAVRDGDMGPNDAASERYRLGSKEICLGGREESVDLLPATLRGLLRRSESLYCRIARFEEALNAGPVTQPDVHRHLQRLEQVFGSRD